MSKRLIPEFLTNNVNILSCPICCTELRLIENSLKCSNKHCFDLAKNGYVNFLVKHGKTQYNRGMFESRKYVNKRGFFKPLTDEIKNVITDTENQVVLDLGCGEGSHLLEISGGKSINIGIDISKEAVKFAQSNNPKRNNTLFCVADIARVPVKEKTADIITNILSPYNTGELNRLLKTSGTIIKAIPGPDHLSELRKILFKSTEKEIYSNENIVKHFCKNFAVRKKVNIKYRVQLDSEYLSRIIDMTPLSFNMSESESNNIFEEVYSKLDIITSDILLLLT